MVLDLFYILLSLLIRLINNNALTIRIEKHIVERYLNLYQNKNPKQNTSYNVFSDKDAIEKVFFSND